MFPMENNKAFTLFQVKGLERMSSEEWMRTLDRFSLEKMKMSGDVTALHTFLGGGEGGAELFFLGSRVRMCGKVSKLHQARF